MNIITSTVKSVLKDKLFYIIAFILLAILPIVTYLAKDYQLPSLFGFLSSEYTIVFLCNIFMYIIMAVGYAIFSGPTNYISLAVSAFFGIGVYISALYGNSLPFPVVVFVGGLASFVAAVIIGALTLRLKGVYFTVFTFGLVALMSNVILYIELRITHTRGRNVVFVEPTTVYYYMLAIVILLVIVSIIINKSRYGLALKSIGQNEDAAAHIGINVTMVKVIIFAIGAFFTGMAGSVMATKWTYIDTSVAFNMEYSFMAALMAIFGGATYLYGVITGAVFFGVLEEILLTKFPYLFRLIFGLILVFSIMFMPTGIAGLFEKWRMKRKARLGENNATIKE